MVMYGKFVVAHEITLIARNEENRLHRIYLHRIYFHPCDKNVHSKW